MATLDEITKEKQRISEALARVDMQREKLARQLAVMSPEQCRAARGWLGWSRDDLARQANVSLRTVAAFDLRERKQRRSRTI
jgi:hypothetical protein